MSLQRLDIRSFRNISEVQLSPEPEFNIIYGQNGSGKTSILEAIYMLGMGRSFRSHLTSRIVQHEKPGLTIFAEFLEENGQKRSAGIEKHRDGQTRIRLDQENQTSIAEMASILPIQLMNTEGHRLLDSGPKYRREFLDWGVFHVEQSFLSSWRRFTRILKQRNAALKQNLSDSKLRVWDPEFIELSEQIDQMRADYIDKLLPLFEGLLGQLLEFKGFSVLYYRGWSRDGDLTELMNESLGRDQQLFYTQYGPQRADLRFKLNGIPLQDVLSRGQQKLYVCALRLAQGLLLRQETAKKCLFLFDDLPTELDGERRALIADVLSRAQAQVFITGIDKTGLTDLEKYQDSALFHVKHGSVERVV